MLCGEDLTPVLPVALSPTQVLDGIALLLDKCLMHRETDVYGEPRYPMLETVREYGLEQLAERGQEQGFEAIAIETISLLEAALGVQDGVLGI